MESGGLARARITPALCRPGTFRGNLVGIQLIQLCSKSHEISRTSAVAVNKRIKDFYSKKGSQNTSVLRRHIRTAILAPCVCFCYIFIYFFIDKLRRFGAETFGSTWSKVISHILFVKTI